MPREAAEVRGALLDERVAALDGLVGAVAEAGGLAGEELLSHQAVIDQVEGELEHALRGGALRVDLRGPLERDGFELLAIYHSHPAGPAAPSA